MNLADNRSTMTAKEFLQWVETLPEGERYELVSGEPIAMSPERNRHNLVKTECWLALRQAVDTAGASTKGVDTSKKLLSYFQLASVEHYLVVDPTKRAVIHHYRSGGEISTALVREGSLQLDPPGIKLEIADFFARLDDR